MPKITDQPPREIAGDLVELRTALDAAIPAKVLDRNLLIATWNIRRFGGLTEKWASEPGDHPRRDLHALRCIAEIVSRFDVMAIQEVLDDTTSIRAMFEVLGTHWGLIMKDKTRGLRGNAERLAFVFDTRKVRPYGLVCELVIPQEQLERAAPGGLDRQFARTPYAATFRSRGKTFTLVSPRIIFGETRQQRVPELRTFVEWLRDWLRDERAWDHNLIALGDFQIDHQGSELYEVFTSTGLYVPPDMLQAPRTIFERLGRPVWLYDQIAWFRGDGDTPGLSLEYVQGGSFDFSDVVLKSRNLSKRDLSWHISDHLPLWAEFSVRD